MQVNHRQMNLHWVEVRMKTQLNWTLSDLWCNGFARIRMNGASVVSSMHHTDTGEKWDQLIKYTLAIAHLDQKLIDELWCLSFLASLLCQNRIRKQWVMVPPPRYFGHQSTLSMAGHWHLWIHLQRYLHQIGLVKMLPFEVWIVFSHSRLVKKCQGKKVFTAWHGLFVFEVELLTGEWVSSKQRAIERTDHVKLKNCKSKWNQAWKQNTKFAYSLRCTKSQRREWEKERERIVQCTLVSFSQADKWLSSRQGRTLVGSRENGLTRTYTHTHTHTYTHTHTHTERHTHTDSCDKGKRAKKSEATNSRSYFVQSPVQLCHRTLLVHVLPPKVGQTAHQITTRATRTPHIRHTNIHITFHTYIYIHTSIYTNAHIYSSTTTCFSSLIYRRMQLCYFNYTISTLNTQHSADRNSLDIHDIMTLLELFNFVKIFLI